MACSKLWVVFHSGHLKNQLNGSKSALFFTHTHTHEEEGERSCGTLDLNVCLQPPGYDVKIYSSQWTKK